MIHPVVAYLAGPYRDSRGAYYVRQNIRAAEEMAVALWREGIPCITPHLNTRLFDGAAPDDVWLAGDLEILRRCDLVVALPGWEHSAGAREELAEASQRGIPVVFTLEGVDGAVATAGRIAEERQARLTTQREALRRIATARRTVEGRGTAGGSDLARCPRCHEPLRVYSTGEGTHSFLPCRCAEKGELTNDD